MLVVVSLVAILQALCATVWMRGRDRVTWRQPRTIVAQAPAVLNATSRIELPFTADLDGWYEVVLRCRIPEDSENTCKMALLNEPRLVVEVIAPPDVTVVPQTTSTGEARWTHHVGTEIHDRYIAVLACRRGVRYDVVLHSEQPVPLLQPCEPKWLIEWSSMGRRAHAVKIETARMAADISQFIGLILICALLVPLAAGWVRVPGD